MAWVVAGGAAAIWCVLVALLAARSEPSRVAPGPPTLDLVGEEPPAIVGLVARDWELERDAVTATVLDLAARRYVAIDWISPQTFLRVREHGPTTGGLAPYERQVLDHLRAQSDETTDGMVPADALTTGPEGAARAWWRRFERAVTADARARGLSRPRWGAAARAVLGAWALVVGLTVGIAASTLPHDQADDDPVGTAIALGVVTTASLVVVTGRLGGERDTPAGRAVAARWLGVREMLADDPTFPVQPPAAVTVWGRLMGYGAALGLTGAASAALPLAAESERTAWSPVGDRWRPVRIRYPDVLPPGYGHPPLLVAALGAVATVLAVVVGPGAVALGRSVLDGVADLAGSDLVPWWVRLVVGVVVATVLAVAAVVALAGLSMLVTGVADLVRPRRTVEGRVLRVRRRGGKDDRYYWHVGVDDGSTDRIRAWRLAAEPDVAQGDTVRASVSRWLGHVRDLTALERSAAAPVPAAAGPVATTELAGPPPPLPGVGAVAAALGRSLHPAADTAAHPLAVGGASTAYVTDDGGRVLAAWVPPATLDSLRALPRAVAPAVAGVGDEAYRAPEGGGLLARVGAHVLLVAAALPAADVATRDDTVTRVAALVAQASDA